MKPFHKICSTILLFLFVLICISTGTVANAATKAKLEKKEITTGLGDYSSDFIDLKNRMENAVYTYASSNNKIVKVNKKTGLLSGVKVGKANIIVKQTYKKKTSTIGICKVTVINTAKISTKANDEGFTTFSENTKKKLCVNEYLDHINSNAAYFVKSSDLSVMTLSGIANSKNKFELPIKTKKIGSTTLTISQKYQGKTKVIGSIKIKVSDVSIDDPDKTDVKVSVDQMFPYYAYIYYPDGNKKAKVVSSDENVVSVEEEDGYEYKPFQLHFLKKGSVTLKYYEGDTVIGEKKITVEVIDATEAKYSEGTQGIIYEMHSPTVFINDGIEFNLTPENANGSMCTAEIGDESICTIDRINGSTGSLSVDFKIKKPGTTTITVKNGDGKVIYQGKLTIKEYQEEK